jgi:Flp pilus assembly protein TadD
MTGQISLDAALVRARTNRFGRMLGRGDDNRVEPECWPRINPSFRFTSDQSFFVIGSCFADNLAERLIRDGFKVLSGGAREDLAYTRYTPAAIWQELAWAHAIFQRNDTVTEADIAPLLLELSPGRWTDLWSRPDMGEPRDRAAALARRKALYAHFRGAFKADVVIISLGLIEAWWDAVSGSYVDFDTAWARRSDRARFRFERLSFAAALDYVERSVALLSDGRRKLLLATSPVVLSRTFTADDIIVANAHSKAVLRAVVGEIAAAHSDVDYFPSYEIATITRQPEVWEDDLVHINPNFVARIMQHVTAAYVPDGGDETARSLLRMANLVEGSRFEAAAAVRTGLADAVATSPDPAVQIAAMRLNLVRGDRAGGVTFALKLAAHAADIAADHPDWLFDAARLLAAVPDHAAQGEALLARFAEEGAVQPQRFYTAFVRLERARDAAGLAALAALVEPVPFNLPEFAAKLAGRLAATGESDRALAFCRRHLAASPDDARLLARSVRIEIAVGALADAGETLRALLRIDPRDPWAHLVLARVHVKRGDNAAALNVLAELDRQVPDHAPGLTLAARLLWKQRSRPEAAAMAQRAMTLSGNDPDTARQLAGILAAQT